MGKRKPSGKENVKNVSKVSLPIELIALETAYRSILTVGAFLSRKQTEPLKLQSFQAALKGVIFGTETRVDEWLFAKLHCVCPESVDITKGFEVTVTLRPFPVEVPPIKLQYLYSLKLRKQLKTKKRSKNDLAKCIEKKRT